MYNGYRLEWLKKIYPEFRENDWNYDNVIRIGQILNYSFYKGTIFYKANINPKQIIGINYAWEYNCMRDITWLELLCSLKRFDHIIDSNQTKEQVINHIHYEHREEKYVSKFGDQYITTGGQHRLCLAKFLDIELVEVNITEYIFDQDRFDKYQLLKQNYEWLQELELTKKYSEDELFKYSALDYFRIDISYESIYIKQNLLKDFIQYYENLFVIKYLSFIQITIYTLLNLSNKPNYNIRINEKLDLKQLRNLIIKHKISNNNRVWMKDK